MTHTTTSQNTTEAQVALAIAKEEMQHQIRSSLYYLSIRLVEPDYPYIQEAWVTLFRYLQSPLEGARKEAMRVLVDADVAISRLPMNEKKELLLKNLFIAVGIAKHKNPEYYQHMHYACREHRRWCYNCTHGAPIWWFRGLRFKFKPIRVG